MKSLFFAVLILASNICFGQDSLQLPKDEISIINYKVPIVINCIPDSNGVRRYEYTANGYITPKTDRETDQARQRIDEFIFSDSNVPDLTLKFNDSLIGKLIYREFESIPDNPFLDYSELDDTILRNNMLTVFYNDGFIKKPVEMPFNVVEYLNNIKIYTLYDSIILASRKNPKEGIKQEDINKIIDKLNLYTSDSITTFLRRLQFEDFVYKNSKDKNPVKLNELLKQAVILLKTKKLNPQSGIMLYKVFKNAGMRENALKALLFAKPNMIDNMFFKETLYNSYEHYLPYYYLKALFYDDFTHNYFIINELTNYYAEYDSFFDKYCPSYLIQSNNDKYKLICNYDFLIGQGYLEFVKVADFTIVHDSIDNYAMTHILDRMISMYRIAQLEGYEFRNSSTLADLNTAIVIYLNRFHSNEKEKILYFLQRALIHSFYNYDYNQYEGCIYSYIKALIDNGYYSHVEKILTNYDKTATFIKNENSIVSILYLYFYNNLKKQQFDVAENCIGVFHELLITDTILPKASWYRKELAFSNALYDFSRIKNDSFMISKLDFAKLKIDRLNSFSPISQLNEIKTVSKEMELSTTSLLSQLEQSKLELKNLKEKAEIKKQYADSLKMKNDSLVSKNGVIDSAYHLLHLKNVSLERANRFADSLNNNLKTALKNEEEATSNAVLERKSADFMRNISIVLLVIVIVLSGISVYSHRKKIIAIKMSNEAQANLKLRVLKYHNIKGLTSANGFIIKGEYKQAMELIGKSTDYVRKLYKSFAKKETTIKEEISLVIDYFDMCIMESEKAYKLSTPSEKELSIFGDIKIPPGILQPLVENSLVHGKLGFDGEVKIELEKIKNGEVLLTVLDNGNSHKIASETSKEREESTSTRIIFDALSNLKNANQFNIEFKPFRKLQNGIFTGVAQYKITST